MRKLFLVLVFMFGFALHACAGDDLMTYPKFNETEVNQRWNKGFEKLQKEMDGLQDKVFEVAASGKEPTEAEVKIIEGYNDELTYWKAVAAIKYYQSQYKDADKAVLNSIDVVHKMEKLLDQLGKTSL